MRAIPLSTPHQTGQPGTTKQRNPASLVAPFCFVLLPVHGQKADSGHRLGTRKPLDSRFPSYSKCRPRPSLAQSSRGNLFGRIAAPQVQLRIFCGVCSMPFHAVAQPHRRIMQTCRRGCRFFWRSLWPGATSWYQIRGSAKRIGFTGLPRESTVVFKIDCSSFWCCPTIQHREGSPLRVISKPTASCHQPVPPLAYIR